MGNSLSLIKTFEDKPVARTSTNYFPLHRPGFFWSMMALFVFLIIMANNFFYYQSRDDLAKASLVKMGELLTGQYEACLSAGTDANFCQQTFLKGVQNSWGYGKITIVDAQGNTLLEKENDPYKEHRSIVVHDGVAGTGEYQLSFVMSKRSSPPLWLSSVRSMFLSVWEIPWGNDWYSFFTGVAVKRSSPLFYAVITLGLFFGMQTLADRQRRKLYSKIEAENFIFTNDLKSTREQLKSKISRVEALSEKIKSHEQTETKLLEAYVNEITVLEAEIDESKAKVEKILGEQKQRENELSKLESKEDITANKIIQTILLSNPKVPKQSEPFQYNDGKHHSREFVERIAKAISNDDLSRLLITKINSTAYNSDKTGEAVLEWENKKQIYVLNVYDHGDEGYAAEIVLSKNAVYSAYIAKYLLSGKNYLAKKKYSLTIGSIG